MENDCRWMTITLNWEWFGQGSRMFSCNPIWGKQLGWYRHLSPSDSMWLFMEFSTYVFPRANHWNSRWFRRLPIFWFVRNQCLSSKCDRKPSKKWMIDKIRFMIETGDELKTEEELMIVNWWRSLACSSRCEGKEKMTPVWIAKMKAGLKTVIV
jgi:hypothetical protein